jgi:hypothetical protein
MESVGQLAYWSHDPYLGTFLRATSENPLNPKFADTSPESRRPAPACLATLQPGGQEQRGRRHLARDLSRPTGRLRGDLLEHARVRAREGGGARAGRGREGDRPSPPPAGRERLAQSGDADRFLLASRGEERRAASAPVVRRDPRFATVVSGRELDYRSVCGETSPPPTSGGKRWPMREARLRRHGYS